MSVSHYSMMIWIVLYRRERDSLFNDDIDRSIYTRVWVTVQRWYGSYHINASVGHFSMIVWIVAYRREYESLFNDGMDRSM